ncbi:MAG: hypothetical protein KBD04_04815 [Proteobacteria bacterium]|nr:hypothetical protein [Pseudomonadota bacterium]
MKTKKKITIVWPEDSKQEISFIYANDIGALSRYALHIISTSDADNATLFLHHFINIFSYPER